MNTIGIIYEITGNPYFGAESRQPDQLSEYAYPSEINDICKAFIELNYRYEVIDGAFDLLKRWDEVKQQCLLLFNKSIGFKGLMRKMPVPALGYMYDLPILGSSAYAMTLARHKYHTCQLLKGIGLPTPQAEILYSLTSALSINKFPVIVKPNAESDSLGISESSVCYSMEQVRLKSQELAKSFGFPIIIEEFIEGDEIKAAVIGNLNDAECLGCVRVLKNGESIKGSLQTRDDIIKHTITYENITDHVLNDQIKPIAKYIHKAMELSDYSRVDFRLGSGGKVYCMEVSTHPDISREGSSFIMAALQKYPDYPQIINAIIESCRKRLNI